MTAILAMFARWGLPEWIRKPVAYAGAILTLFALLWLLKGCYDDSVIDKHEAGIAAQVQIQTSEAAVQSSAAVTAKQTEVEKRNDEARKAARDSSDPLRDGLNRLHH